MNGMTLIYIYRYCFNDKEILLGLEKEERLIAPGVVGKEKQKAISGKE